MFSLKVNFQLVGQIVRKVCQFVSEYIVRIQ